MNQNEESMENTNITMLEKLHFFRRLSTPNEQQPSSECIKYKMDFQGVDSTFADYLVFPGAEIVLAEYHGKQFDFEHISMEHVMQINICLQGRMGWSLHNGDCIYLGAGDISIHVMDNCAISSMSLPLEYYKGIIIFLDLKEFPLYLPESLEQIHFNLKDLKTKYCDARQTTVLPANVNTESVFLGLKKIPDVYKLSYFKIKLQELLLLIYMQDWSKTKAREPYSAITINAIKAIHEQLISDFKKRPTIEELSKKFFLNTSTLKIAFKAVYGQPIAQYMKKYRMQFAASLLCQTSMQVGEISESVGYESQSKFAKGFKEIMQISPVEYRNRYRMKKKK